MTIQKLEVKLLSMKTRVAYLGAPKGNKNAAGPHQSAVSSEARRWSAIAAGEKPGTDAHRSAHRAAQDAHLTALQTGLPSRGAEHLAAANYHKGKVAEHDKFDFARRAGTGGGTHNGPQDIVKGTAGERFKAKAEKSSLDANKSGLFRDHIKAGQAHRRAAEWDARNSISGKDIEYHDKKADFHRDMAKKLDRYRK